MTSSSLTAPKLRLKPLFLIGAIVVLAGLLLAAVDHFIWGGVLWNHRGLSGYIGLWFAQFEWFGTSFYMSSILDGGWLERITLWVVFEVIPLIGAAILLSAVLLFGVYVVAAHRSKRSAALLSLSLMLTAFASAWELVDTFSYTIHTCSANEAWKSLIPSFLNGRLFDQLPQVIDNLLISLRPFTFNWISAITAFLIGICLLIAAVALTASPRVGKGIAVAGIFAAAALVPLQWLTNSPLIHLLLSCIRNVLRPLGDMSNPSIVWIPNSLRVSTTMASDILHATCMLLFLLLFAVLLISNRLQPVFGKK